MAIPNCKVKTMKITERSGKGENCTAYSISVGVQEALFLGLVNEGREPMQALKIIDKEKKTMTIMAVSTHLRDEFEKLGFHGEELERLMDASCILT